MTEPANLIVVRHGETLWNVEGRLQGQMDSPLTARGLEQARLLGQRLSGLDIDRVVSSDQPRALRTAELVCHAAAPHCSVEPMPELRERRFGVLEGLRVSELDAEALGHYERAGSDARYAVPDGESRAAVWDRAVNALFDLGRVSGGQLVLVVTHGGVLSVALRAALGLGVDAPRPFLTPNCAFNHLRYESGRLLAVSVADTSHLLGV